MRSKSIALLCLLFPVLLATAQKKQSMPPGAVSATKVDYQQPGSPLPEIKVFTKDGRYLTNKELENDAHLFLMLFNPTCDHCADQTFLFKEHIDLFKKTHLVLMAAPNMIPHLEFFTNTTRLNDFKGIEVGVDSSGYIEKVFQYMLPQINIYDRDRKLVRIFKGPTPIDSLRQYID